MSGSQNNENASNSIESAQALRPSSTLQTSIQNVLARLSGLRQISSTLAEITSNWSTTGKQISPELLTTSNLTDVLQSTSIDDDYPSDVPDDYEYTSNENTKISQKSVSKSNGVDLKKTGLEQTKSFDHEDEGFDSDIGSDFDGIDDLPVSTKLNSSKVQNDENDEDDNWGDDVLGDSDDWGDVNDKSLTKYASKSPQSDSSSITMSARFMNERLDLDFIEKWIQNLKTAPDATLQPMLSKINMVKTVIFTPNQAQNYTNRQETEDKHAESIGSDDFDEIDELKFSNESNVQRKSSLTTISPFDDSISGTKTSPHPQHAQDFDDDLESDLTPTFISDTGCSSKIPQGVQFVDGAWVTVNGASDDTIDDLLGIADFNELSQPTSDFASVRNRLQIQKNLQTINRNDLTSFIANEEGNELATVHASSLGLIKHVPTSTTIDSMKPSLMSVAILEETGLSPEIGSNNAFDNNLIEAFDGFDEMEEEDGDDGDDKSSKTHSKSNPVISKTQQTLDMEENFDEMDESDDAVFSIDADPPSVVRSDTIYASGNGSQPPLTPTNIGVLRSHKSKSDRKIFVSKKPEYPISIDALVVTDAEDVSSEGGHHGEFKVQNNNSHSWSSASTPSGASSVHLSMTSAPATPDSGSRSVSTSHPVLDEDDLLDFFEDVSDDDAQVDFSLINSNSLINNQKALLAATEGEKKELYEFVLPLSLQRIFAYCGKEHRDFFSIPANSDTSLQSESSAIAKRNSEPAHLTLKWSEHIANIYEKHCSANDLQQQ